MVFLCEEPFPILTPRKLERGQKILEASALRTGTLAKQGRLLEPRSPSLL